MKSNSNEKKKIKDEIEEEKSNHTKGL